MKLVSLLSGNGFVLFNKELAHEVSVNGAIIFGQLCSSYESFGSKSMLTMRDGKDFFFLTSDVIEEETALTYKQQMKAIKDLEEAGYIETVIMGTPAKKYFHITDRIIKQILLKDNGSTDKKEELNEENERENAVMEQSTGFSSYAQRENQACYKGKGMPEQKVNTYKNNNEKEQSKIINNNLVNKESVNKTQEIIDKLVLEYMKKGLNKQVCLMVIDEVNAMNTVKNLGAYLRTCLENTLYKSKLKRGKIDFYDRSEEGAIPFYNWLEQL